MEQSVLASSHRVDLRAEARSLAASAGLHGLLLIAGLALLRPQPIPPLDEGIPVEIWTPAEVEALAPRVSAAPVPEASPQAPPDTVQERTQVSAAPEPLQPGPPARIRATRILSGEVLASPLSRAMRQALPRFDEETRIEQLCGIEAMAQIAATLKQFQPDRVVAYAMADVKMRQNRLIADGAAFRSAQHWYHLQFICDLSADRRAVHAFEFAVGDAIPRRLWGAHNLPPVH